jgi:hypothetical protein
LEKLLADLDMTNERLSRALSRLSTEELEQPVEDRTLGDRMAFACWHDTYHVGQTEYLRQLAGTDDKVI